MMSGLRLAALYGIIPHKLGLCGPRETSVKETIYDFLCGKKINFKILRGIFKQFYGAYGYYKVIADCNNIKDYFDEKVVRAYWVGNKLLEKVNSDDIKRLIISEFSKSYLLTKKEAEERAKKILENSKPHHSFHVFVLGPIGQGVILKDKALDMCRVSWGKVKKIFPERNEAIILYKPIIKLNNSWKLSSLKKEKNINWDKKIISELKIDDWVSFHWNQVAEKLNKRDLVNLKKYTENTLNSLNKKP